MFPLDFQQGISQFISKPAEVALLDSYREADVGVDPLMLVEEGNHCSEYLVLLQENTHHVGTDPFLLLAGVKPPSNAVDIPLEAQHEKEGTFVLGDHHHSVLEIMLQVVVVVLDQLSRSL